MDDFVCRYAWFFFVFKPLSNFGSNCPNREVLGQSLSAAAKFAEWRARS